MISSKRFNAHKYQPVVSLNMLMSLKMKPVNWSVYALLALICVVSSELVAGRTIADDSSAKYIVVVLGDSLSDTGNDFAISGVPDKHVYWNGRFSNGPVWTDYVMEYYSNYSNVKIYNYAYGGSTACNSTEIEEKFPFVKDLAAQTLALLTDIKTGKVSLEAGAKLVIISWTGANDFLPMLRSGAKIPTPEEIATLIRNVVLCRMGSIRAIAAALASFPVDIRFAVIPTAPMAMAPQVIVPLKPLLHVVDLELSKQTEGAVRLMCKAFHKAKPGSVGHNVEVHSIGVNSQWVHAGLKQVRPPFKYFDDVSCFKNPASSLNITGPVPQCPDPNDYAFFDTMHPTTNFHKWFGLKGLKPRLERIGLLPK